MELFRRQPLWGFRKNVGDKTMILILKIEAYHHRMANDWKRFPMATQTLNAAPFRNVVVGIITIQGDGVGDKSIFTMRESVIIRPSYKVGGFEEIK